MIINAVNVIQRRDLHPNTSDTDGYTSFYIEILVNSGHEKSLLPSSHTGYVDQLLTALGAIDQLRQEYRFFESALSHNPTSEKRSRPAGPVQVGVPIIPATWRQ